METKTSKPFYKNRIFLIIAIIAGFALLSKLIGGTNSTPELTSPTTNSSTPASTSPTNAPANNVSPETYVDGNAKALEAIRKEKNVIEAIITDADVLYVSVEDDGTRRDGYAQYLCQILKENHAKINWVKITKVGSTNDPDRDNAYGVLLGEAHCD